MVVSSTTFDDPSDGRPQRVSDAVKRRGLMLIYLGSLPGSPLNTTTDDQVAAIRKQLPDDWQVYGAMPHADPGIDETLQQIVADNVTDLVVIPMCPQYAGPSTAGLTTGSALEQLYKSVCRLALPLSIEVRSHWHDDAGYIEAHAQWIHQTIAEHGLTADNAILLYSAPSLVPFSIDRGDPYEGQVRHTVDLVNERLGWPSGRTRLSFQKYLATEEPLKPCTAQTLIELAAAGERRVLVCPVGFSAGWQEALGRIGIDCSRQFEREGGRLLVCPGIDSFEPFVKALSVIARRGTHSASRHTANDGGDVPLIRGVDDSFDLNRTIASLIMVGVSIPGRLAARGGLQLNHLSRCEFRRIKRPQSGALQLVRTIHEKKHFEECWLWNTCSRFEFYGCRKADCRGDASSRDVADVARTMFADNVDGQNVNVLQGVDAWHHLLHNAVGLNSSLPGDIDVVEQLAAAFRLARHAGVAGTVSERLLAEVRAIVARIRSQTPWGRFGSEYCYAALKQLAETSNPPWSSRNCVVIGSSTTSRAILHTLIERFEVEQKNLTIVYRGGGRRQMIKQLRQAIGHGRRILVQHYGERATLNAIAGANIVFIAVDQAEPFLQARQLADLRRDASRPLTIVDFNTFGSTDPIDAVEGVHLVDAQQLEAHVDRFADEVTANHEFHSAARAARDAIAAHVDAVCRNTDDARGRLKEARGPGAAAVEPLAAALSPLR